MAKNVSAAQKGIGISYPRIKLLARDKLRFVPSSRPQSASDVLSKIKKKCLSRNSLDRFVWQRSVASLVLFVLALKTVLASVLKRYWQINVWAIE